jgi:hypothetical protein
MQPMQPMQPGHQHQDFYATAPPPPRRRRTGLIVAGVASGVLALVVCGGVLAAVLTPADPPPVTFSDPATPGADAPTTRTVPAAPAPAAPVTAIKDGTWTAGTDFPPGRYEVTSDARLCAWQVYTGQEPDVVYVDPGHVGPGHYTFTFTAGQHLMTQGCGTWRKAG